VIRHKAHLAGRGPRWIDHQVGFDRGIVFDERSSQHFAGFIFTNEPNKNAAGAQRRDSTRDVARASQQPLFASDGHHQCRRLRRHPRHLAVDEMVQHKVTDA
jgi:hypothetical protein